MEDFDFGKYRLVACDMDGTLLGSDLEIPEKHRLAAKICEEHGVAFAICTGRAFAAVERYRDVLGSNGYLIAYNGARISSGDRKTELLRISLLYEDVLSCLKLGKELDATACVWADEKLYVNKRNQLAAAYGVLSGVEPIYFETDDPFFLRKIDGEGRSNVDKVFWTDTPERAVLLAASVRNRVPETVNFFTSGAGYMEFIHKDADKGRAIRFLLRALGAPEDASLAFGDAENDLPMMRAAGLGVAMGNAEQAVKDAAGYVTSSNDEGGVYEAIRALFGKK